ncbi:MAG: hypothetical protein Q7S86_00825 [bacterium]|nr:hypothetical protein [bacterium]
MCKHKQNSRQTSTTATPVPAPQRSLRRLVDSVDYSRFDRLNLPIFPKEATPSGVLGRTHKRLFLLWKDAEAKPDEILEKVAILSVQHAHNHVLADLETGSAQPNCKEHHQELRALRDKWFEAKADVLRLKEVFGATLSYDFGFRQNGDIRVFKGGRFTFTPVASRAATSNIPGLENVPPQIAEIVRQVAEDLGASSVTVQRLDSGDNASHEEILELIRQFDQAVAGSRNGDKTSDNGNGQPRPRRSHFGESVASENQRQ